MYNEVITVIKFYAQNNIAATLTKQKLQKIKVKPDKSTLIIGEFRTLPSDLDRLRRKYLVRIKKT